MLRALNQPEAPTQDVWVLFLLMGLGWAKPLLFTPHLEALSSNSKDFI